MLLLALIAACVAYPLEHWMLHSGQGIALISGLVLIAASLSGYAWASLRTMLRQAWQTVPRSMRQWLQRHATLVNRYTAPAGGLLQQP